MPARLKVEVLEYELEVEGTGGFQLGLSEQQV